MTCRHSCTDHELSWDGFRLLKTRLLSAPRFETGHRWCHCSAGPLNLMPPLSADSTQCSLPICSPTPPLSHRLCQGHCADAEWYPLWQWGALAASCDPHAVQHLRSPLTGGTATHTAILAQHVSALSGTVRLLSGQSTAFSWV
jgi:hypothetical protein